MHLSVSEELPCFSAQKELSFLQGHKARHFCSIDADFENGEAECVINHFYSQMKFCVTDTSMASFLLRTDAMIP